MSSSDTKFAYLCEWRDPRTDVLWKYELYLYPDTREVEMLDTRSRKLFLKRCNLDGKQLVPELLRPGSRLEILSRQLRILDYADTFTRQELSQRQERTLALIKPDAVEYFSSIVKILLDEGFIIGELRMCQLSQKEASRFYAVHAGKDFYQRLIEFMSSGKVVAMELLAAGAVEKWRRLLGPTNSHAARLEAPLSVRAMFGSDKTRNACHGSDSSDTATAECKFFFSSQVGACWGQRNSSLCLIKNHALSSASLAAILDQIAASFSISAAQMCHFTTAAAHDMLGLYKGVVPLSEYNSMVQDLCSGNSLALEVSNLDGDDTQSPVEGLRALCGPSDPVTAQAVRPKSLRAQFGISKVQNAVHCTDLEENAAEEIRIAFGSS